MQVVIVDERHGDCLTDDMKTAIDGAGTVFYIEADGNVRVTSKKKVTTKAIFFTAKHRDQVSAEKSDKAAREREAARTEADKNAEDPMVRATRVWDDEYRGSSGTEHITQAE
jgi:hypothetical protein